MLNKNKYLKFLVPALLIVAFFAFSQEKSPLEDKPSLASLNSKYGLVSAKALTETPYLISQFTPESNLKAAIINVFKPEQQLILKLKDNSTEPEELKNVVLLNLRTLEPIEKIAADYAQLKTLVAYAEPNRTIEAPQETETAATPSQPEPTQPLPAETPAGKDNLTIPVAVIDSGIDLDHPELKTKIIGDGWDFINDTPKPEDTVGHGTHISRIIVEHSPAARIIPLKFTDGKIGRIAELVKAIKFAADNGAQVINLSLGLSQESQLLKEAVDYATEKSIIIVAATGNHGTNEKYYPAAFPNVIAVSALGKDGNKLFISNFGDWVRFSADGQDIYAPFPDNTYAYRTGTSQAAALVTAKVAESLKQIEIAGATEDLFKKVNQALIKISKPIKGEFENLLGRKILE